MLNGVGIAVKIKNKLKLQNKSIFLNNKKQSKEIVV
jgi:hypothetical protein